MNVMNAKGATGILMEVETGEILAMASLPDFDPMTAPPAADRRAVGQSAVQPRRPGSVRAGFDLQDLPVAQALDLGLVNPASGINAAAPMRIGRFLINDFHNYGKELSVTDVIVKSSNVGTVRIAQLIGPERQKDFLEKLGLFVPTSIEDGRSPHRSAAGAHALARRHCGDGQFRPWAGGQPAAPGGRLCDDREWRQARDPHAGAWTTTPRG